MLSDFPVSSTLRRRPKILILYAHTGGGHLSAARAIEAAIHLRHPGAYEVVLGNVALASGSQRIRMLYESYNLMLKADPRYAKHGMRILNTVNAEKVVIPIVPRAYQNFRRFLVRESPDLIVSVHAIVNHSINRIMRDLGWQNKIPYYIVCTDLTDRFLKGWANPDATGVIVFTELARQQMIAYGLPAEKVTVHGGFPVNPSFFAETQSKAEARAALDLDPEVSTILISMGGMAIPRKTQAIARALCTCGLPLQLLVICGMNRSLKRTMHRFAYNAPVRIDVYGFTDRMSEMMSAADLLITKPGPGSIMEAVIKELPLVLDATTEPMPQERGNLSFALEQGIAREITSYRRLPRLIERLLTNPREYERIRDNMRKLKNEEGIFDVVETLLASLEQAAVV
ncbi:MAG: MGDG synthase family glycosyltransferase [Armatimonadota bacterium]